MQDQNPNHAQSTDEVAALRRRVADLKVQVARYQQLEADRRRVDDELPVLVATAGNDGYYKTVNAAFERILGWSEEESLARPFIEFIHPDDRAVATETFGQLMSGKSVTDFVDRNLCKDGSHRWISWTVVPLPDRGVVFGIGQDVTEKRRAENERRQAEEALKQAKEELEQRVRERTIQLEQSNQQLEIFRLFAESSTQGFGMAHMDGHIAYGNPALGRMVGVKRPEDAVGTNLREYYPEAYSRKREREILPALLESGHWQGEIDFQNNGTTTVLQHTFLIRDEKGNPSHTAIVLTDVTERRQAEEALRASEARFRSYFEQGLIGMAVSTPEKRWLEVNDRFCDMLGYSREELVGMKWTEATHPDDLEPGLRQFRRIAAGEIDRYTQEKRFIRKDGRVVYSRVFVQSFRSTVGTLDHFLTLVEDVTVRKEAEKALQKSEERYRVLVETCPDAVTLSDLEGRIIFASQQAVKFYGADRAEELVGQTATSLIAEEERLRAKRNMASLLHEGVRRNTEYTLLRKDGSRVPSDLSSAVVRDSSGRPQALMAVIRDISERKQAQAALERERRTLLQMLRASDHERQLIAYDIHDGLAQQLTAAIMQFQTYEHLKDQEASKARTAYEAGVEMVQQAHSEARRLISGVRPPILDESGITAALAHLVYEHSTPTGPDVEFHCGPKVGRLAKVLENSVYRIAQESLANAFRHSGSDRIRVAFAHEDERLCLEVRDWGVGFDSQAVPEDRFGLEGIKERARLLGGECSIESELGKGTCVRVVLPIIGPK